MASGGHKEVDALQDAIKLRQANTAVSKCQAGTQESPRRVLLLGSPAGLFPRALIEKVQRLFPASLLHAFHQLSWRDPQGRQCRQEVYPDLAPEGDGSGFPS
jgi:hypothetical protein